MSTSKIMVESQNPGLAGRQSALTGRISTVLSTSYSDLEIRDAITELDKRNFINTAESRRQLRFDIQDELIKTNGQVLADFSGVVDELKEVEVILARITSTCATLRSQIQEANQLTSPIREETADLLSRKQQTESQQQLLKAFQKQFIISDDEINLLTSSETVDDEFFRALVNLKRIHSDSHVLLAAASDQLGLSILDQSGKTLNMAFQKLFRWTQKEFRTLDLENPRLNASMRKALRVLAERPTLFNSSVDNFASTRETTLSNAFHVALTGQGDDFVGRPIEYQAHDPLRYISDMLAWAHSATVSEREALEILFIDEGEELAKGIQEGVEHDVWSRANDEKPEVFDGNKALKHLVARDVAGVGRLLRQRSGQVIQGQEDAIVAFKMANMIAFYRNTFKKLVHDDSDMIIALTQIQKSANRQFRLAMEDLIALMKPELDSKPESTNPPEFLKEALTTLRNLLKSFDESMATIEDDFTVSTLIELCFDPFLEGSEVLWNKLASPKREILAINCQLEAISTLSPYAPDTKDTVSGLENHIKSFTADLTRYMHTSFLSASGLEDLVVSIVEIPVTSIAEIRSKDTMKVESLSEFSASLDAFLPEALADASEELRDLRSAKIGRGILEEAAERFCDDFESVEARIVAVDEDTENNGQGKDENEDEDEDEENEKVILRQVFPRTSAEIKVLLS